MDRKDQRMSTTHFDVGVIGSGPAGLSAAFPLQAAGKSVVIIEEYLWGGTCPNYGCDPKKVLLAAVEAKEAAEFMRHDGLIGHNEIDWPALMAHKMAYTDPVPARKVAGLDDAGVTHKYGHAQFVDDHTVSTGLETITADTWIIATGARPTRLEIPGDEYLQDNEDFLNLPHMPNEVAFIGGGFIAIEFAGIAQAAGAKVHVIVHHDEILREFDQDLTKDLIKQMEDRGITFHWNFETAAVEKLDDGTFDLIAQDGRRVNVEAPFLAAGRTGNVDHINIEAAGVEVADNGVKVGPDMRTTNPNIFAVGDVASSPVPKLTPTGAYEARYVAGLLTGTEPEEISYPAIPTMVYGSPKLGQVGMSAVEAEARGLKVNSVDMTPWLSYWRHKEPVAKAKVVLNEAGVIVGATVLSGSADELLNYFTVAINNKQDKVAIKHNLYSYPSIGSDMGFFY
jgi:glutathione reductase (NADPH)